MPVALSIIRQDLKNIRYYYSRKKLFDEGFQSTGMNEIVETIERYNDLINLLHPNYMTCMCLCI